METKKEENLQKIYISSDCFSLRHNLKLCHKIFVCGLTFVQPD